MQWTLPCAVFFYRALCENELDKHLGKSLVKYIKDNALENSDVGQSVMSRKKARTLGEYQLEYRKKQERLIKYI